MFSRLGLLFKVSMGFFCVSGAFLVAGTAAIYLGFKLIGALLAAVGMVFFLPGVVIGWIDDKRSATRISRLNKAMQSMEMVPAMRDNYPWLDKNMLRVWSDDLANHGFTDYADFTIGTGKVDVSDFDLTESFTRVLVDTDLKCYGEITQTHRKISGTKPLTCSITTVFASGQWCRTANTELPVGSIPDCLGITTFAMPGTPPAQLVAAHMQHREQVAADQNTTPTDEVSVELYRSESRKIGQQVMDWAKQRMANARGAQ